MSSHNIQRRLLSVIKWLVIILLIVLLAFVIFVTTFDANQYKSHIENTVSRMLDRRVELRGNIDIATSLIPTVVARNVHLDNNEWAAADDFAIIDRLSFNIELFPLVLEQDLVVDGIELEGVRIHLEKSQAGDTNWEFGKQDINRQTEVLSAIKGAKLENIDIIYRSPQGGEQTYKIYNAYAQFESGLESLDITARLQEETVAASLQRKLDSSGDTASGTYIYQTELKLRDTMISANAGIVMQEPLAFDVSDISFQLKGKHQIPLQVESGYLNWGMEEPLSLTMNGKYNDLPVRLEASAGSINALFEEIDFPVKASLVGDNDIVELEGTLSEKLTNPAMHIQAARINKTEFKGRLAIDRSGRVPVISGLLQSNKFSLDDIEGLAVFTASQRPAKEDQKFKLPANINMDLVFKANQVDGLLEGMREMQGKLSLQQGKLKVSNAKIRMPSGMVSGSAEIISSARGLDYSLQLNSQQVNVQKMLRGHKIHGKSISGMLQAVKINMQGPVVALDELMQRSRYDLKVGKSGLQMQGVGQSEPEPLQLDSLQLVSTPGKSTNISLQGQLRNAPFSFDLQTADYAILQQASTSLPVKYKASYADHVWQGQGEMSDMQTGKGLHVTLDIKGDNLQTLGPLFKIELKEIGPYALTGRLDAVGDEYSLSDIKAKIANTDAAGSALIDVSGDRPFIKADLHSKALHINDVFDEQDLKEDDRLIPNIEIPVQFLNAFDAVIDIKAEKYFDNEIEYGDFVLHASLKDGYLQVDPLHSRLAGALVDSSLHIDTRQEQPELHFTLNSKNTDYGALLEGWGWTDRVEGMGDVEIDVQGAGARLREVMANANGQVSLKAGKGTIHNPNFDRWATGLVTSMLSSAWETKETSDVQCIVGRFDIKDGIVTTDTLMLDTSEITVAGTLTLDLKAETIDALIQPAPKNPSFISLSNPVKLSGNLHSPEVTKEQTLGRRWGLRGVLLGLASPATLLFMYSELGTGVQNPCYEAAVMREAKEEEAEKEGSADSLRLPGGNLLKKLLPDDD